MRAIINKSLSLNTYTLNLNVLGAYLYAKNNELKRIYLLQLVSY